MTRFAPLNVLFAPLMVILPSAANVKLENEVLTEVIFGCAELTTVLAIFAFATFPLELIVIVPLLLCVMLIPVPPITTGSTAK